MKVVLSFNEIEEMKKIMESVEKGSSKELIKCLQNNKLINVNADFRKQQTIIDVNEKYMTEYLSMYGKFMSILSMQVKCVIETIENLQYETDKILDKYTKEEVK